MAKKLVPPANGPSPTRMLEQLLKERLIGQDRAINEIVRSFEIYYAGIKNPEHPIATLAFFGPTGTGKTLAAKVLASCFKKHWVWRCSRYQECQIEYTEADRRAGIQVPTFCPRHKGNLRIKKMEVPNLWRINCGTMSGSQGHAVANLLGSPTGYVGHDSTPPRLVGGKAPRVVLFDEAEKALLTESWNGGGSDFANVLLEILDEGKIVNNLGEVVDFTNSIIILTGNLGAKEILKEFSNKLGFSTPDQPPRKDFSKMTDEEIARINQNIYTTVKEKAERELAPEFLNRLDRLIVFHFLTRRDYAQILDIEIAKVVKIVERAVKAGRVPPFVFTFSTKAIDFLVNESMSDRLSGGRSLVRKLAKLTVAELAKLINARIIKEGDHLEARIAKGTDDDGKPEEKIIFYRLPPSEDKLLLKPPEPAPPPKADLPQAEKGPEGGDA